MDTKTLISDAKARFSHNSAKAYLKEKYKSKLIIAEQGGLWKADAQTIALLQAFSNQFEFSKTSACSAHQKLIRISRKFFSNSILANSANFCRFNDGVRQQVGVQWGRGHATGFG